MLLQFPPAGIPATPSPAGAGVIGARSAVQMALSQLPAFERSRIVMRETKELRRAYLCVIWRYHGNCQRAIHRASIVRC